MPSDWEIFSREAVALLPVKLIQAGNEYIPDKKRAIMMGVRSVCDRTAHHLISEKSSAFFKHKTANDIMSLLGELAEFGPPPLQYVLTIALQ